MNGGIEDVVTVTKTVSEGAHDLSMFSLFAQASLTVKGVIILLILCSIWSWAIIFAKSSMIRKLRISADKFEDAFWNCGSLEIFFDGISNKKGNDPFLNVFAAGMNEWRRTRNKNSITAVKERVETMMRVAIGREMDFLEQHIGFLGTVGSTAPFVGLFGTIWGIMNCFEAIGLGQSVASGISEALFATALGLVVTIPSIVAYNKISGELNRYHNRLDSFVDEFSTIISRQMEG
ncbi:hypothetical protein FACS189449_00040 [Alphaproteobacteria bacterium]|nr:hypothetical protein FACS189449_00040 [Alphaproteobacteria bacterium]